MGAVLMGTCRVRFAAQLRAIFALDQLRRAETLRAVNDAARRYAARLAGKPSAVAFAP